MLYIKILINILFLITDSSSHPHVIEGTGLSATFGKKEALKIHQENLQKISELSSDEILEEQKKLLQMLG